MTELLNNLFFIFQRLNLFSVIDIVLVTLIFYSLLYLVRDTQAMVLLRGAIFLVVLLALLTALVDLPAFSWLVRTTLPALLLAIPVIFAPEIRRALERIGRAGTFIPGNSQKKDLEIQTAIQAVVSASARLSSRQHGALIILQRLDSLEEYVRTGVFMDARLTPELLLQVFYPNTPLHDGAVIVEGLRVLAGACVMPLSASGILVRSPERQMGLRHRAALGISEASDAIAVVVSEETGSISIAHAGRMIRRLDPDRLENILSAFYRPERRQGFLSASFPLPVPTGRTMSKTFYSFACVTAQVQTG
jgi:diadenylate cyclase